MTTDFERSPARYLRLAGLFYLAIIALGLFGESYVRGTLVIYGDAAATASHIAAAPQLWRAGIVADLCMQLCDLPVIVALYLLLKPVSKPLALLASWINLMQTAVLAANKLNLLIPLFLAAPSSYLQAFTPAQLHALSYLAIKLHGFGFGIGLLFFGVACLVRGYLVFRATYLPNILGILLALAGLSYLINSFALLLAPTLASALFPAILLPAFVGELAFSLWLIIKGVHLPQWQQQASAKSSVPAS
ncbi:DUF4386 domain-containing protein [Chitinimonas naiadis]